MRTEVEIEEQLLTLRRKRSSMVEYLRLKLDSNDMHAVQDAGSDIRELDAQISALEWAIKRKDKP